MTQVTADTKRKGRLDPRRRDARQTLAKARAADLAMRRALRAGDRDLAYTYAERAGICADCAGPLPEPCR